MKFAKSSKTEAAAVAQPEPAAAEPEAKPVNTDLLERRKFIRPLPSPVAVESDQESDWAAFSAQDPNN